MADKQGFVYILTNPSFKDDWVKIGKSSRSVDVRSKELDNTAVPLPFEIFATLQSSKFAEVEKQIHKSIDRLTDLRIRQNREFFNIAPEQALELLLDSARLLDDAIVIRYTDGIAEQVYPEMKNRPIHRKKKVAERRSNFQFGMVGIKVGERLVFDPLGIEVKVADERKVEYEGRLWTLTAFAGEYMPDEMRNSSEAYQGPKYFSYKGKNLVQLRHEQEKG